MAKVTVKMNSKGMTQLLKSNEVTNLLKSLADEYANRCGPGYEADVFTAGRTRNNASVGPRTPEAARDNLRNNTLLKNIRGVTT